MQIGEALASPEESSGGCQDNTFLGPYASEHFFILALCDLADATVKIMLDFCFV